ncbi:DUF4123 domain-containing protein [Paraherbaspirillum soli]|uniref:DUF4123 domain-containing protein n=1 Tax=Paraherbaspirillum soli TaxID=631222 RepID=A0ABW0M4A4_9BURK
MTYYAQNPLDIESVNQQVLGRIAKDPELHWALLIDTAFDYEQPHALPLHGVNCYDGQTASGLADAAPWLLPLYAPGEAIERTQSALQMWLKHCNRRPMLSIVASRKNAHQIAADWRQLHFVKTGDSQQFLLRFADTRVLTTLPTLLTTQQWAALSTPLMHWLTADRQGALVAVAVAPVGTGAAPAPFELSNQQVAALTDAAEADAVINHLAENMEKIIPQQIAPARFYADIVHTLALAKQYQLEHWPDKLALITAACLTLGKSNKNPALIEILLQRRWYPGRLGEAMDVLGVVK